MFGRSLALKDVVLRVKASSLLLKVVSLGAKASALLLRVVSLGAKASALLFRVVSLGEAGGRLSFKDSRPVETDARLRFEDSSPRESDAPEPAVVLPLGNAVPRHSVTTCPTKRVRARIRHTPKVHAFGTVSGPSALYTSKPMVPRIARLAALALLALAAIGCASEPPLDAAKDVDLSRFQGKWYEIARLPRLTQTDCYGTTAFYTASSDGSLQLVHQCNVGSTTGPLNTVTMLAKVPNPSATAKLALSVGGYSGDYWILEVGSNYEYAVVGHPSRSYFWILSRAPTLEPATMQGVLARAESNHFDTTQLEFTPQPPSGERVSSDAPVGPVPPPLQTGCAVSAGKGSGFGASWLGLAMAAWTRRGRRSSWHNRNQKDSCSRPVSASN